MKSLLQMFLVSMQFVLNFIWCVMMNFLLLLNEGAAHAVDSSELAFRLAAIGAVKQGML